MPPSYHTHFNSFGDDASPLDPGRSNSLAEAARKGDFEGSTADLDPRRVLAERLVSSAILSSPTSQEVRNKQLSDWKAAKKLLFKGKSTLTTDNTQDVGNLAQSAKSSLQRPKPTTSDSFKKLLRRNTQPQSITPLPSSQVDEEERRLRHFVEQQDQSTVRPSLAVTQEFARNPQVANGLPSIFSPASGELIPSRSARRTLSNSSLGSGASRIREATSSFLRRLRASRTPSSSVDLTPRPREHQQSSIDHPRTHEYEIATVQRPQSTTPSTSSDPHVSRGLYKSSSSASVQSYRGTDDSLSGSSAIYPSSQSNSSYTSAHNLVFGGTTSASNVSGNRSRGLIHKSSNDLPRIQGSPANESVIEGEQQTTQPLQSDKSSCKPPLYHRDSFVSAKQAHGALKQIVHPYSFVEQPPTLRKARSSTSVSKTHSSTSLEMPQTDKGSSGWRSRFGGAKRDKGEAGSPTSSHGALLDRFTLDKKTSQDSMSQATYGRKETQSGKSGLDEQDEREMAAQHIARQQRAANDARLAEALPIHSNGKQKALKSMPSATSYSPHSRLEEYRNATRNAGLPSNGKNNSGSNLGHGYAVDMERTSSKGHGSASRSTSPSVHRANTSSHSSNDEASCPVCLELLSFRLAGEKAHVVPLCGHALHHACFTAVYGAPEVVLAAQQQISNESAPGMCGVCRRLIILPEETEARRPGKLAGMMGVENDAKMTRPGEQNVSPHVGTSKGRSSSAVASGNALYSATNDDPLDGGGRAARESRIDSENTQGMPTGMVDDHYAKQQRQQQQGQHQQQQQQDRFMIFPTIKVRPEFETVYLKDRNQATDANSGRQNVVCVISVEVPPRRRTSRVEEDEALWQQKSDQYLVERKGKSPEVRANNEDDEVEPQDDEDNASSQPVQSSHSEGVQHDHEDAAEQSSSGSPASGDDEEGFSFSATPAAADSNGMSFASVVDDLRHRIVDWKGHSVDRFGNLVLFDFLGVRQDSVVREFYVYLFKEALLCVNEERKKERGLSRLIPSADRSFGSDEGASGSSGSQSKANKGAMKLKGRIWLRHIRRCQNLELDDKPCLSIKLDDEALDHFVLCFKDRSTRETWRLKLTRLLDDQRRQKKAKSKKENDSSLAARKTIDESPAPAIGAAPDGSLSSTAGSSSHRSPGDFSQSSHNTRNTSSTSVSASLPPFASPATSQQSNSPHKGTRSGAPLPGFLATLPSHQQWSASGGLDPGAPVPEMLPHTPLDLVIMISVPSVTSHPAVSSSTLSSSAALKLRLIRSTLDFVIANVGPGDRIALVAYNVGVDGLVRRTALLNVAKAKSRERLEQFVDTIGKPWEGPGEDPFREDINRLGGQSDRTDTVTAVNVGFDIVLQRKSRNPTTGMLLINDTADAPKRGQMDLIMARAEAANVPVHCFGFGKSHDPSSLWLISNHTRGSYTFVKEWYQLRECVAGCLGALMSIALTDVKLHISVPSDNHFRVRKVAGCTGSIISSSGKDVDLELGEMRFGECKELFLELELDFTTLLMQHNLHQRSSRAALASQYEKGSATDDFMQRLGLQGLSIVDSANDGEGESGDGPSHDRKTSKSNADLGAHEDDPITLQSDFVDDIAVLEVHCGCRDPSIGVGASRLPDPCVLTIEVDASSDAAMTETNAAAGALTAVADPLVTRRRMEILVSDMITRCLLLVSRRNHAQALTILLETRKIVDTVLQSIPLALDNTESFITGRRSNGNGNGFGNGEIIPGGEDSYGRRGSGHRSQTQASLYARQTRNSHARKQREMLHRRTAIVLMAILEDLDVLIDGLEAGKSVSFERSERNFGAQQAMVLRDQKAWTSRSDTEWQFFKMLDNGPAFAALAAHFAANFGR